MTNKDHLETVFFYIVFVGILVLTFFLFKPFLIDLMLAGVLAIVLYPLYLSVKTVLKGKDSLSSLLTILISIVFIMVPLFFIAERAFFEAKELYSNLSSNNVSEFDFIVNILQSPINQFGGNFTLDINQYASSFLNWLTGHFKDFIFGTIGFVVDFVLVLIALFFFLRDGEFFVQKLIDFSPFRDSYDKEIMRKVSLTVSSVVKGNLLIGLIQGFLVGLGLFLFSVPNAFLWGIIAALSAFVPGLGTGLVIIPAVIYLFVIGNTPYAFALSLWGMILVGMIDNILAPILYKRGTKIHSLIMLFSVLGGISFFGPEGFIFGPVIVSVFMSFLEIYNSEKLTT